MTFPPTLRVKTLESVAVVNWSFVDVQCGRRTVFPLEQRIWRSSSMWNVQRSKQPTENGKMRRENGKLPIWLHWRYILTFFTFFVARKCGKMYNDFCSGWEGATKGDASAISSGKGSMCDQPICKEDHCGPYGYCVRPNECVCAKLTSKVRFTFTQNAF